MVSLGALCAFPAGASPTPLANTAPVWSGPSSLTLDEDSSLFLSNVSSWASDPDGDTLTFAAAGTHLAWVDHWAANGTFELRASDSNWAGTVSLLVSVNDGNGSVVNVTVPVTVSNVNDAPALPSSGPDITVNQDQMFVLTDIVAADADLALWDQGVSEALIYSDDSSLFNVETVRNDKPSGEPQYLARIALTATNDQAGTWFVNITVTDLEGANSTMRMRIVVNNLNDPPTSVRINITDDLGATSAVTIPNQKVSYDEGDSITMQVLADDPDLAMRANDPAQKVDPNEMLTCTITATFTGSLDVPQSDTVKPTIDPDTCLSEFSPGNNEVGTFTIVVTVRDQSQASTSFRFQVEIKNVNDPPIVGILNLVDGFSMGRFGPLELWAFADDPDTPDALLTFNWRVEVEDGQVYTATGATEEVQVSNAAPETKNITVRLVVTDNLDAVNPLTIERTVGGTIAPTIPLSVAVTVTREPGVPDDYTFRFVAVAEGGSGEFVFDWRFEEYVSQAGNVTLHTYDAPGTYQVSLYVRDNVDMEVWWNSSVTVEAPPAGTLLATASSSPIANSTTVHFVASAVGGNGELQFLWDFGDGTTAGGAVLNHTFSHGGYYNIALRVTDGQGAFDWANFSSLVPTHVLPALMTSATNASASNNATFRFSASVAGGAGDLEYFWDFGDNTTAQGAAVNHTYEHPGSYEVRFRVTDGAGQISWSNQTVTVAGPGPASGPSGTSPSGGADPMLVALIAVAAGAAGAVTLLAMRARRGK